MLTLGIGSKTMERRRAGRSSPDQSAPKARIIGIEETVDSVEGAEKSARRFIRVVGRIAEQHCDLAPVDRMRAHDPQAADRELRQLHARHQLEVGAAMSPRDRVDSGCEANEIAERTGENDQNA